MPADIQFIIGEKPHDRFEREGNNLVMNQRVPLADALCGLTIRVATLDNRVLTIPIQEVITPGFTKVVKGEGACDTLAS